jgi:hypothetical protein
MQLHAIRYCSQNNLHQEPLFQNEPPLFTLFFQEFWGVTPLKKSRSALGAI